MEWKWNPRWRLAIGLFLCGVLVIALIDALMYQIPDRMKAKTCIAWALENRNVTLYLADYIRGAALWPSGVAPADRGVINIPSMSTVSQDTEELSMPGTLMLPEGIWSVNRSCVSPEK